MVDACRRFQPPPACLPPRFAPAPRRCARAPSPRLPARLPPVLRVPGGASCAAEVSTQRPALDEAGRLIPTRQRARASTGEATVITCAPEQAKHVPLPPLSPHATGSTRLRTLAVGVIGPGRVGSALLAQLRAAQPRLARTLGLDLRLCGVVARKRMWLDCDDAELNDRHGGAQTWRPNDLDAFAAHVRGTDGLHVVTPNKLAGSGPLPRWQAIHTACAGGARFRCEATVCAGLPVVQTLRDLLDTGDELLAVEGMFSGTLAWLCNRHDGRQPFSALVREAHALGYTEPDPRDDLSGLDVARKLVILAREAGWPLSLEDVDLESLVPASLAALDREEFFARLGELDAPMAAALARSREAGGVLRHVAHLDRHGHASVRLQALP